MSLPSHIHYEISSHCNLKCPLCWRTKWGDGHIPLHLSYESVKKTIHKDLQEVLFCGNLGDPLMHPKANQIFDLFDENITMQINTNGSIREPSWYRNIAQRKNLLLEFSIDGLEDTNHLYRIDAKWKEIMTNTSAFIEAGGKARWTFIFFKHNEHQFDQVKQLAKDMGFAEFKTKISQRTSTVDLKSNIKHPAEQLQILKDIECFAYNNNQVFINATGIVDLCTWSQPLKFARNINDESFEVIMERFHAADTELQKIWMTRSCTSCNKQCGIEKGGTIKEVLIEY